MELNDKKQGECIPTIIRDKQTETDTFFSEDNTTDILFLKYLQDLIVCRYHEMPEGSYTTFLFRQGINRMAQKLGEEAIEMVIEATNGTRERLISEASDFIYHLMVLLVGKNLGLEDLIRELKKRHKV